MTTKTKNDMLNPSKEECVQRLAPFNSLIYCLENSTITEQVFIDQYINAIKESGIDPKKFAETNGIDSERLYHFFKDVFVQPAFHNHDVNSYQYLIINGSKMAKLHDFLGVKIKTIISPRHLGDHPLFHEDFPEALELCSEEERANFARLFSETPEEWFT